MLKVAGNFVRSLSSIVLGTIVGPASVKKNVPLAAIVQKGKACDPVIDYLLTTTKFVFFFQYFFDDAIRLLTIQQNLNIVRPIVSMTLPLLE